MKRFFSRFSAGPSQLGATSPPPDAPTGNAQGEGGVGSSSSSSSGGGGNSNVRSLTARFESLQQPLPGAPQRQPTSTGIFLSASSSTPNELLTPSSSIAPALQSISVLDNGAAPTSASPLPSPAATASKQLQLSPPMPSLGPSQSPPNQLPSVIVNGAGRRTKETRDASGGSSSTSTSNPHPTKTVAFAPSPKKAVRSPLLDSASPVSGQGTPSSHSTFSFPSAVPGSANGHGQGHASDGSDTDTRSFAKPTAASLARAVRAGSPANASVISSIYSKRISLPSRSMVDGREGSVSWQSTGAKTLGGPSWSEMTEDDLVANLGPRERTRQEVLWEIVASEERYVHELQRTRLLYLEALLHPYRFSTKELPAPPNSPPPAPSADTTSPKLPETVPEHPVELPIAARWMTTSSTAPNVSASGQGSRQAPSTAAIIQSSYKPIPGRRQSTGSPRMGGSAALPSTTTASSNRPSSGGGTSVNHKPTRSSTFDLLAQPSTSSTSSSPSGTLQPLSRSDEGKGATKGSSHTRSKKSAAAAMKSKLPMFPTFPGSSQGRGAPDPLEVLLPVALPAPVRIVLETMYEGLLSEHVQLSDALKNRYQEQWPLVRSLADVFLKHSFLLKHYAVYVCHLERALEYLEEAALMERAMRGKKIRKEKMTQTVAVGRAVAALEIIAAERGEPGLALFISKPFQRLLKYPLLFQNLLFHTDPSTYEFESTVAMVVEVERIVRSIEDEKVSAEERDRTRDAFARIDGITDRAVLKPKADRTLIEEKPLYDEGPRRALSESKTDNVNNTEAQTSELSSGPRASADARKPGSACGALGPEGPAASLRALLKSKRSFRRLSDLVQNGAGEENLKGTGVGGDATSSTAGGGGSSPQTKAPNLGSKRDLWVVRFSDVELKCQRTGTTTLPMVSSAALRPEGHGPFGQSGGGNGQYAEDEVPDFASRSQYSKERLRALRNTTLRAKTRNLYKFVAVHSWRPAPPSAAAAAMAARRAEGLAKAIQEVEVEDDSEDDNDEADEDDEDGPTESDSSAEEDDYVGGALGGAPNAERFVREAKLSFSYWGDDRVEPRPSATYSSTSSKSPALSSVAAFRAMQQNASSSSSTRSPTTKGTASSPTEQGETSRPRGRADLAHLTASGSTPNLRSLSPSKRQAAESVVAGSHATPRVQKFANRLRTAGSDSAPSSAHGHASATAPYEPSTTQGSGSGRISGTHHAQFGGAGGGGSNGGPRASTVGGASYKSSRASNAYSQR